MHTDTAPKTFGCTCEVCCNGCKKQMSERSEIVEALLSALEPTLASQGLVRRQARFAIRKTNLAIVDIQRSRSSTANSVLLTVNIGGVSRRVSDVYGQRLPKGVPAPTLWHWNERLGNLAAVPHDKWWRITSVSEALEAAEDIQTRLRQHASRTLNCVLDDECLRQAWMNRYSPGLTRLQALRYLAALLATIGPREGIPPVLEEIRAISGTQAKEVERRIQQVARAG